MDDRTLTRLAKSQYAIESPVIRASDSDEIRYSEKHSVQYVRVTDRSRKPLRQAAGQLIRYFKSEYHKRPSVQLSTDWLHYAVGKSEVVWLVLDPCHDFYPDSDPPVFNAIGFALMTTFEHVTELSLVWIHPFRRRGGLLTDLWRMLGNEYSNLKVFPPLSDAMQQFLYKIGYLPK